MELASLGVDLRTNGVSLVCGSMAGLWCLIGLENVKIMPMNVAVFVGR